MQFFVVFHQKLFDECYEKIPPDVLQEYFTFFAVNQSIPKEYTPGKYNILNEWDLPIYDPTMQEKGYRENSAIYHVYANGLHRKYGRIGFFQYDMKFNENIVETIEAVPLTYPVGFAIAGVRLDELSLRNCPEVYEKLKEAITLYERAFGKKVLKMVKSTTPPYSLQLIRTHRKYPLLNSYVISNECFERVMRWIVTLYPKINFPGYTATLYESIMGIALGTEDIVWRPLRIDHDHTFKKPCY
jgi:hypothetical protein